VDCTSYVSNDTWEFVASELFYAVSTCPNYLNRLLCSVSVNIVKPDASSKCAFQYALILCAHKFVVLIRDVHGNGNSHSHGNGSSFGLLMGIILMGMGIAYFIGEKIKFPSMISDSLINVEE